MPTFNIEKGDILGFLGRNGAGKSTTMRMITGYLSPTSGAVFVDGLNVFDEPLVVKKNIGYLPETPPVYMDMTVSRYLKFVAELKSIRYRDVKSEIARVSDRCGITHVSHRLIRNLSKGFRQRVGLAQALLGSPSVLILDEPTAGVDIEMRRSMYEFLRETNDEGRTIILTTHYLEEAELLCRNVAIINQGKIVTQGAIRDLLRDLNSETFILDTQEEAPGDFVLPGFDLRKIEHHSLEVDLQKGQDLAQVFSALSERGITVVSMRNKENRLERMFVNVLEGRS